MLFPLVVFIDEEARMNRSGSHILYISAICLAAMGSASPASAGYALDPARHFECGRILDDCVPVCDWTVPQGGRRLAGCYNTCYRQIGACEASRIPRPGARR
jgi:hypothetical protein